METQKVMVHAKYLGTILRIMYVFHALVLTNMLITRVLTVSLVQHSNSYSLRKVLKYVD